MRMRTGAALGITAAVLLSPAMIQGEADSGLEDFAYVVREIEFLLKDLAAATINAATEEVINVVSPKETPAPSPTGNSIEGPTAFHFEITQTPTTSVYLGGMSLGGMNTAKP